MVEITDVILTDFHELGSNIESVRFSGEGSIHIVANDLDNSITVGDGEDVIEAGTGNDYVEAGAGNDFVDAGAGNDLIFALEGNDTVEGGEGDDYIGGYGGDDRILGQDGDDSIWAGDGDDYIDGGDGTDSAVYLGGKLNYNVTPNSDGTVTVVHKAPEEFQEGPFITTIYEGRDFLKGIEKIVFADGDTIDVASLFVPVLPEPPVTPVTPEPPVTPPTPPTVFTTATNFTLPADALDLTASGNANVKLTGNALNNSITGNAGKNAINAGSGNDKVNGGLGNDSLTGGKGKDAFLFTTKLNKKTNVDKINDFKVVDDTVYLDDAIFKKVGKGALAKPGKLNKSFFTTGEKAKDTNDHIIYNKDKGILYYDADGSGKRAAVQFATIDKKLKLGAADFLII
jgi:Ca2+-binding RTX toxin-like protein